MNPAPRTLQEILIALDRAMTAEDIPDETRRKVMGRLVWGESSTRPDMTVPQTVTLA